MRKTCFDAWLLMTTIPGTRTRIAIPPLLTPITAAGSLHPAPARQSTKKPALSDRGGRLLQVSIVLWRPCGG